MSLKTLCRWLAATPASQILQDHQWMVPAIQTVHILCIAALLPAVLAFTLRLAGIGPRRQSPFQAAGQLLPWIAWALPGLLATGVLLIITEPSRELPNGAFQIKMALLAAGLMLLAWLRHRVNRPDMPWASDAAALPPLPIRLTGAAVLLLWMGIVVAGRWIAYVVES